MSKRTAIALTALCLVASTARADGDLLEKGRAAYALGHYAEAAAAFEEAFRVEPTPALLYNAAQSHRLAGEKRRALELYRSYVRVYRKGKNFREASHHVTALEEELRREPERPVPPTEPAPVVSPVMPVKLTPPPPEPAPVVTVVAPQPAPPPEERPIVRSPWFWTAVAGVVLAAGGATWLAVRGHDGGGPAPTLGRVPGN